MYYFAYASNLSKQQMRERCPDSRPRFSATLPNYKLAFLGWSREWHGGKASIQTFKGEKVRGAVYEVTEACLKRLDRHEAGYSRLNVTVFSEDNEPAPATTYIISGRLEESSPSREYLARLRQGYEDWGLF